MSQTVQLIAPTADAVTTAVECPTNGYTLVIISAAGLASSEEVDIFVRTAGGDAIYAGTGTDAFVLTATAQARVLPAGPLYTVKKDATSGSVGVYCTYCTSL